MCCVRVVFVFGIVVTCILIRVCVVVGLLLFCCSVVVVCCLFVCCVCVSSGFVSCV